MDKNIDANWQNPQDKAQKAANASKKVMKDTMEEVQDRADQAVQYVQQGWDTVRQSGSDALDYTESLIKDHPFIAVAGAVAVGAIIGSSLARRS